MYCRKCGNNIDKESKFCTHCGEEVANDIRPSAPVQESPKIITNDSKFSFSINRQHEIFSTYKSLSTVTSLIMLHIVYNLFASVYSFFAVSWLDGIIVLVIYSLIGYYYLRISNVSKGNYLESAEANKVSNIMKTALVLFVLYYLLNFLVTAVSPDVFTTEELDSQYSFMGSGIIAFIIYYYFYSKTKLLLTAEAKNMELHYKAVTAKKGTDILRLIAWSVVAFFVLLIVLVLLLSV